MKSPLSIAAAILSLPAATALGAAFIVPGSSDVWLAGTPDGTTASLTDTAPGQSPVLVSGVTPGVGYTFVVHGSVNNFAGNSGVGPDGRGDFFLGHLTGAENGIAGIVGPLNSLIGVFLEATSPVGQSAPGSLDFSSFGLDFTVLNPALRQPFFIGDGLTSTAQVQAFMAPSGASRLYLGTMDGFEWVNNDGAFNVTVEPTAVPEIPASAVACGIGLLGYAVHRRRCRL